MYDLPSNSLFQQNQARKVTGEYLEMLGKEAANLWSSGQCKDLSTAVVETVKEARLSPEQVKRVVEFTNVAAFLSEFNKEGAGHKYVDFGNNGIAHPNQVLQDLNDGGGGTVFDPGNGDYFSPVPKSISKQASQEDEFTKAASVELFPSSNYELPYAEPFADLIQLRYKVASAYENATSAKSFTEGVIRDLSFRLSENVKQAAMSGVSLGDIVSIWSDIGDETLVKSAFEIVLDRLYDEDVFPSVEAVTASLSKVASGRVPNPAHPLVTDFQEFCEAAVKLAELHDEQLYLGEALKQATTILTKVAAHPGGYVGKGLEVLQQAAQVAKAQGERAGAGLFGEGKGKALGTVAKGLTYAVPGLIALKGAKEVAANPVVRSLKDTALSVVPGTQQYYAGQYPGMY